MLLESMQAGDCVAFVGAGFSAPVGMPLWRPLLTTLHAKLASSREALQSQPLLKYALQCLKDGELARAASALRRADLSAVIDTQLRDLFDAKQHFTERKTDVAKKEMTRRLKSLLGLPWAGIITTNYDTIILDAIQAHPHGWRNICERPSENLGRALKSSDRPFFIHLHGNTRKGHMILTEEDYDAIYHTFSPVDSFLRALLLRYTVVFIGTSVEDRFVQFKRELQVLFRNKESESDSPPLSPEYVLLAEDDEDRAAYLRLTGGFRVLTYGNVTGKHEGLSVLMDELRRSLSQFAHDSETTDAINKALVKIVSASYDWITLQEITDSLWKSKFVQETPDFNRRELYYRLRYLVERKLIKYNRDNQTFGTA